MAIPYDPNPTPKPKVGINPILGPNSNKANPNPASNPKESLNPNLVPNPNSLDLP